MKIKDIEQANRVLGQYVPNTSKKGSYKLVRMKKLMDVLGNPQNNYKVIHVAGTAGKTSTTYYLAELLRIAGKKVGHTVSPHIDEVNERVQINSKPLSEDKFCQYLVEFLDIPGVAPLDLTYFEVLVGLAFWVFAKEEVDYAVIEVGLGGLLDGTNIVETADKVCVITDIGLDHTKILGSTVEEIALQKAGIIKPANEVFMLEQKANITGVIASFCDKQSASLRVIKQAKSSFTELPIYQQRNFYLAHQVYEFVAGRDNLPVLSSESMVKATSIVVPGRMEKIKQNDKTIILDGAHNEAKFAALSESLRAIYGDNKVTFVIGMVETKKDQIEQIIKLIKPLAEIVICTNSYAKQDLPYKPLDPSFIAKICEKQGLRSMVAELPKESVRIAKKQNSETIVVTGSLYLLGSIREIL